MEKNHKKKNTDKFRGYKNKKRYHIAYMSKILALTQEEYISHKFAVVYLLDTSYLILL
jgi:hypothetical protein